MKKLSGIIRKQLKLILVMPKLIMDWQFVMMMG